MRHLSRILLALTILATLSACGRKAQEKAMEKAIQRETGGPASVRMDDNSLQVKTDQGEFTVTSGKSAKLPDNFPKDIPLYKGTSIEMSMQLPEGYSVVLKTKDAAATVTDFYAKEMTAKGWKQQTSFNVAGQSMLTYEKDGRSAVMAIGSQNDATMITLTIANEEKSSPEKTAGTPKDKDDKPE